MIVLISGSRSVSDFRMLQLAIDQSHFRVSEVVTGAGIGPEHLAQHWSKLNEIPCVVVETDIETFGEATIPGHKIPLALERRNQDLADRAEAAIFCYDGYSAGSYDLIQRCHRRGIPVHVHRPREQIHERWWV